MQTVSCAYCGLPFKTRTAVPAPPDSPYPRYYCCTGCAMLAGLPVDDKGQFPVNAHLVSALAIGFLYFNQLLFWLLATLLTYQEKFALAHRFSWLSAVLAFVVWGIIIWVQKRENTIRLPDCAMFIIALVVHIAACVIHAPPILWLMASANALLIFWSIRGLLFKRKKRS